MYKNDEIESKKIAHKVKFLIDNENDKVEPEQIAILCRTKHGAKTIEKAFIEN
jgi:ATP-dependent exoDNAse (exonuclease V) beta subunit